MIVQAPTSPPEVWDGNRDGSMRFGSPPLVPTYFTGRTNELAALKAAPEGLTAITAVAGIGGVGKTQLAAYHYRSLEHADTYPLMAWLDGRLDLGPQLVELAIAVRLPEGKTPDETVARLVSWLRSLRHPWLLVIDNAPDPDHLGPLLQVGGSGHLLITSRYTHWQPYGHVVDVDAFPTPIATALLRTIAGRSDDPYAEALADHLGGLALALSLAGATCRENAWSFSHYLTQLRTRGPAALIDSHDPGYDRTLTAVWTDSLDAATIRAPAAPLLLAILARLDWRNIDRSWLTKGLKPTPLAGDLDATLAALAAYHLTTLTEQTVTIAHGIIATGASTHLAPDQQATADDHLLTILDTTLPNEAFFSIEIAAAAAPAIHHLHTLATAKRSLPDRAGAILNLACHQLNQQADSTRFTTIAMAYVDHNMRVFGPDASNTTTARHYLALSYRSAYNYNDAISTFEEVIANFERVLGSHHPYTMTARHELALTYSEAGRTVEAIRIQEQLLADRERATDPDRHEILASRHNLAISYRDSGRINEAIHIQEHVVADVQAMRGLDHPHTINTRNNLALCYREAGRITDAIRIQEKVLVDSERILGASHPGTTSVRLSLAVSYYKVSRDADAITLQEQVLGDYESSLGSSHRHTQTSRLFLGILYNLGCRTEEAIRTLEQLSAERERALGLDDPTTLTARTNLATAYLQADRTGDATTILEQVVANSERALGLDDPATLTARTTLAAAYLKADRAGEATTILEQVVANSERALGLNDPATLGARTILAAAYLQADRTGEATTILEQVVANFERALGPRHPATLTARELKEASMQAGVHTQGGDQQVP
jgi:tetratricopeptide (TPR) repeat protein